MTVDIALAALTVSFALYANGPRWKWALALACAILARESALALIAGYGVYLLSRRRVVDCLWLGAATLPALAWFVYVRRQTQPFSLDYVFSAAPFAGLVERLAHPAAYPLTGWRLNLALGLDYVALAGVVLAVVFVVRLAWARRWNACAAGAYALALSTAFLGSRYIWEESIAYGRTLTPLMLLTMIEDREAAPAWRFLPMLLVDARIGVYLTGQIAGVVRGLAGW
jgi:hypothetical protein